MRAEWEQQRSAEREMTICIAASCVATPGGTAKKIVLCTDWRVSGQLGSAETLHKQAHLHGSWWCLTAGSTEEINATIHILRRSFKTAPKVDETTIKNLIEQSLRLRLTQKRDALAHARYSMSYEDVFRSGKENLPEAQFVRFITDASLIQLEAESS